MTETEQGFLWERPWGPSSRSRESGRGVFISPGISSECSRGSLDSMNVELMEEAGV